MAQAEQYETGSWQRRGRQARGLAYGERTIDGSDILVAAERIPNTAGIDLENAGVEVDERGYVRVNERLETSAPDVWALGECAGPRNSRISRRTTFASSPKTLPEGNAARATGWFPT